MAGAAQAWLKLCPRAAGSAAFGGSEGTGEQGHNSSSSPLLLLHSVTNSSALRSLRNRFSKVIVANWEQRQGSLGVRQRSPGFCF